MLGKFHAPATFVLDGSVTLAWFFDDEISPYTESVEDSLQTATAIVPSIWTLEIANALLVGERRKRTSETKTEIFLQLLSALPIAIDDQTNLHAFGDVFFLARINKLSAYDAAYLELALRRDLPLATLDTKLKAAADAAGVKTYSP